MGVRFCMLFLRVSHGVPASQGWKNLKVTELNPPLSEAWITAPHSSSPIIAGGFWSMLDNLL